MLFSNMMMKYQEEAGADGAAGGGAGAGDPPKTYTAAEVEEMISRSVAEAVDRETKQLKNKNDELIGERRKDQERVAREKARADGKFDDFEKSIRDQYDPLIAEKDAKISAYSDRILGSERKAVMGDLLVKGKFIDPEAEDILAQFVKTEFDGDAVVTKFVGANGQVITTDVDKFIDYCKKHKVISRLMQADAASGGGAMGGKNSSGGAGQAKYSALKDLPVR